MCYFAKKTGTTRIKYTLIICFQKASEGLFHVPGMVPCRHLPQQCYEENFAGRPACLGQAQLLLERATAGAGVQQGSGKELPMAWILQGERVSSSKF